jgi:hypothetical protein
MNANVAKVQSILENTFNAAFEMLSEEATNAVSDIYIQVDRESGEVQIYDDSENLLGKKTIFDWIKSQDDDDVFTKKVIATLKAVITLLQTKGVFDNPQLIKPLSISLTDESFVVIEELFFIDDDLFRLDDPLLQDLDTELNDFIDDLLSDQK